VRVLMDYRPALRSRSGVGEYAHQLAAALLARNVELLLFSSSWKDRLVLPPELRRATPIDLRIPVSWLNFAWHRIERPAAEVFTRRRFDIAHSPHPLLLPTRYAAQIVTIHDITFMKHPEQTRAEIRRDYPALAARHANRADHVIVSSRFAAREVERELGVPPERISVCPAGAPDWPPRRATPKDGYLLFLGTLEPRKNVGTLLDAYERLLASPPEGGYDVSRHDASHDAPPRGGTDAPWVPELVLAGRATPEARGWLDRIARPPLAGRVRHVGYVADADRRALYEGARLLIQPSFEEGFGLTVLEAMSIGVPVIASNRGALPELIDNAGVLIDPGAPDALAAAIQRLLGDEAFAAACAAGGEMRARQYRWADTAERVIHAYEQAVVHKGRKRCA
jgi:glycosyltransferase involved in cell wall biosynthesis